MRNIKIVVAVLLLAAFAGLLAWRVLEARREQSSQATKSKSRGGSRVVHVDVGQARIGGVREEILLTGALKPKEQVDITAKVTGRVEKILVQIGDRVRQGQLIAELEDDELQQQVNRASAAVAVTHAAAAQRKAELANAKADLDRAQSLLDEGLIPRRDYDARRTSYEVVEAQLRLAAAQEQQAQAELNELKIRLQQSRIYSPMTGLVARRYVDQGALVSPSTPIVNIVNLSTLVTAANVPEREVAKLRVGNQAKVFVDAFGERPFQGRVARIGPVLDAATRSALVEVEIANPDGGLKAEMFARVILDLASTRQSVLIPRDALVYRGQQPGVYLLNQQGRPVFRPIETGLTEGNDVEVLANLEPGTSIITRGASMLREGDAIRVAGRGAGKDGARPGGGKGKGGAAVATEAALSANGVKSQ